MFFTKYFCLIFILCITFKFLILEDKDFPLNIEPEAKLKFPEHLKVFTYEMDSDSTDFPEPKRCQTGNYNNLVPTLY